MVCVPGAMGVGGASVGGGGHAAPAANGSAKNGSGNLPDVEREVEFLLRSLLWRVEREGYLAEMVAVVRSC